jgi:hypothetical protein
MLILLAIMMAVTALAAGLSAPPARTPTATPEPSATKPASTATAAVERTIDLADPRTVVVNEGDLVRLTVTGDEAPDVVELVGLDLMQPIAPDSQAVFDLLADRPGRYELRLVESGRSAGALEVTPADE